MRKLFRTRTPHTRFVGSDADGIQLRALAHYINDPEFTKLITEGDIHTSNMKALGPVCKSRDVAKTFIYSWLLGAGVTKTAEVLGCTQSQAKIAREKFLKAYPGLHRLKTIDIPRDARQKGFYGIDGRFVKCDSEHHMLAGYLQNFEALVMKAALRYAYDKFYDAPYMEPRLIAFVHDETLWETFGHTGDVGAILREAYTYATKKYKLNCPVTGGYDVGLNWYEVH
jgi:DNA polymerase I-like protein with 3'-5' exonuclease and polymerase domains